MKFCRRWAKLKLFSVSLDKNLHFTVKSDASYNFSLTLIHSFTDTDNWLLTSTMKQMECHMVNSIAVNTDIPFSLNSSKARRIFTLNTREERRLEKVHWNLEKQRMAESKRFLKAKKDVIIHYFGFRKVYSAGQTGVHDRLLTMNSLRTTSQELLPTRSGSLGPQWSIPEKKNSKSKETCTSQRVGTYCSHTATVSCGVLPHMPRILVSEGVDLTQRCRSWSSSAITNFRCLGNKEDSDKVITEQSNSPARKNLIHEPFSKNNGKEKLLTEVLPPIILPPLHSQKEKTIKEKHHTTLAITEKVSEEKLWNGLEDCRYLRAYAKKDK